MLPTRYRSRVKARTTMLWALPPPDLTPLAFDLRPMAAVVESVDSTSATGKFRQEADKIDRSCRAIRLEMAATLKHLLAMAARAELDGYKLDVAAPVKALESKIAEVKDGVSRTKKTVRKFVGSRQSARIPGANTLNNSEAKIVSAFDGAVSDLEDYLAEFKGIAQRMNSAYKNSSSPMTRVEHAYRHAFDKILGYGELITTTQDEMDGVMTLRMSVPISRPLLFDPKELLAVESKVHDEVALEDESLVGRVALDYVQID